MKSATLSWIVVWGVLLCIGGPALAQDRGAEGQEILMLITEEITRPKDGQGAQARGVDFWWRAAGEPAWTSTDKRLNEALQAQGVQVLMPGKANISRIYRTASLSRSNAATLGSLLGARRVLVGQVTYQPSPRVRALELTGVEASATIYLMMADTAEPTVLQRFTIERQSYGANFEEALVEVQAEMGRAMGRLMGRSLMRGPGPIGIESNERLIGLRNAESGKVLEDVKAFLVGLETVQAVRERWAAEGLIALEINPGVDDADDALEYVLRVLENHSFDSFQMTRRDAKSSAPQLVEFWIDGVGQDSF